MPIILDHHLREQINHISPDFPVAYFHDEMADLPNRAGPVHWHPEFEIVSAKAGVLDYQVGEEHVLLEAGDRIFVNSNMLHGISQAAGDAPDPMPGIVFPGTIIAPEGSRIYQRYIRRIAACDRLPYIVFRKGEHEEIHAAVERIYGLLDEGGDFYELGLLAELIFIFESLNRNFEEWPRTQISRVRLNAQIRVQQMLSFIYLHYAENVTLADISAAASISRSEAGRCFAAYLHMPPIEYLVRYRLEKACELLADSSLPIQEISQACGFHSTSYFTRRFRSLYGYPPGQSRMKGK